MNSQNLYQTQISTYLEQVYKSAPDTSKFITISSHHIPIPEAGLLTFPKPTTAESEFKCQNRYFITGITIHPQNDNLAQQLSDIHIQIICGGQTWISGQLGLLNLTKLKTLVIPLPSPEVEQEIELLITRPDPEKQPKSGSLTWLCVAATEFHGEDMPCHRQIIYSVPETGIIHDSRNTILGRIPNRISRIEVYIPDNLNNLDVELPLDHPPKIYCDDLAMEPMTNGLIQASETASAGIHHQVSGPGPTELSGYKTYYYTLDKSSPSVIRLDPAVLGTPNHGIRYSIIEKQIVRMKSGYIGLAF